MYQYNQENTSDIKLPLLAGEKIYIGDISIEPLKLRDIAKVGYNKYMNSLGIMLQEFESLLDISKIPEDYLKEIKNNMSPLDLIFESKNHVLILSLIDSLKFLFKADKITYRENDGVVLLYEIPLTEEEKLIEDIEIKYNEKYINKDNYSYIVDVLKLQNGLMQVEEKKYNPADEKAREIMEKIKRGQEIAKKNKKKDGDLDLQDIISAVAGKSNNLNILDIWDLTVYQLYDHFQRLEMVDGYGISMNAMMHGADIKNVKHWSSKMKDDK